MSVLERLQRITLVTGHYGSGKTNLAINLALDLRQSGKQVVVVDLDIVNPYFRSSDFTELLHRKGIETAFSPYSNSTLDIPALSAQISGALAQREKHVVIDVGGDDAGATALGRYSAALRESSYTMLYVVNRSRYLTREPAEALDIMQEIQHASRLEVSYVVNNTHLAGETTAQDILDGIGYAQEVSRAAGRELLFTTAPREIAAQLAGQAELYPVDVYVKAPWQ